MRGLVLAALVLFAYAAHAAGPQVVAAAPWKGDLDEMLERRLIRFAVPYSRTLYVNDGGRAVGLSAQLARDFERHLNRKYRKKLGKRPLVVKLIPTARNDLLLDLTDGFADVAGGVTESHSKLVDFVAPADRKPSTELVLTRPDGPVIASVEDLAGKTVQVRKSSSYHESLQTLNDRLRKEGKAPVRLVLVPEALEDEDMMEMLNAGLLQVIVVDDWKARPWARVLRNVKVNDQAAVGTGAVVAWAIRKDSPELHAELTAFFEEAGRKEGVHEARLAQAIQDTRQIGNSMGDAEIKRFQNTLALFRKYGEEYGFDPLMLAAQGYQLSRLDQRTENYHGAVGVMQVMPQIGKTLKVGNIRTVEPNIHAAAKYMDQLMARHFEDADFDDTNRNLFASASYHAGGHNIAAMRAEAERRGLDPNQWFNNVEIVYGEKLGLRTPTYVRNVYKYYVAYKLMMDDPGAAK